MATTAAFCLLASALTASAVTFKVDSTQGWQGYVNVVGTNGFANYVYGSPWALADLRAGFTKTNSNPSGWPLNDFGIQQVNTNTYAPGTGEPPDTNFWNFSDGTPNKLLEANWYVDVGTNYGGQAVIFEGTVISNSIPLAPLSGLPTVSPSGWHVVAWVKEFTPTYAFVDIVTTTNLGPGPFSVTNDITAGYVAQYGFYVYGPNTAPGSANALAGLRVAVEDADPGFSTQPTGVSVIAPAPVSLTAVGVGATALTHQWQKDGTNVVDGGTISGANTTNLVISSTVASDSGDYTCIVTDTAGSATSAVAVVNIVNILITSTPEDQRVPVGADVVFSASATSSVPLIYRWLRVDGGVTNILGIPPDPASYVSGAATDTLVLNNVQLSDTGIWRLRIYDGTDFVYTDGNLLVRTCADWVNFLENSGFESGKLDESPWNRFESTDPIQGAVQDATDTYFGGGNVDIYDGTYVSFTTYHAVWSGIYQDVDVEPGQVFVASMYAYNASGDPIPGPGLGATNQTYLEVQFRDAGDNVLQQYISDLDLLASTSIPPQDVWVQLAATNAGDYGGGSGTDGLYLEAPPNSAYARFQISMHDQGGSSVGGVPLGSLYYDSARFEVKLAAEISVVDQAGGSTEVSWQSNACMSYRVEYKDNIDDASWTLLEVVAGDGTVITKSYASGGPQRFYRVLTM